MKHNGHDDHDAGCALLSSPPPLVIPAKAGIQ